MAADLWKLDKEYSLGDPWTPEGPNEFAIYAQLFQRVAEEEHDVDGLHVAGHIAHAWANCTLLGGVLTVDEAEGFDDVGSGLTRIAAGIVEITFDKVFQSPELYIAVPWPCLVSGDGVTIDAYESREGGFVKTGNVTRIAIRNSLGTLVDRPFCVGIYGV